MRAHNTHTPLNCEWLEARDTPAGNVTAMVSGGAVFVDGDGAFNRVRIEQDGVGNMFVIGLDGTTVNGQSAVFVGQGTPAGVFVTLNDGQDYLEMVNVVAGGISVSGGNDGDGLWMWNVSAFGNIDVRSEAANDTVFLSGVWAGNVLTLDGGSEYDIVHVDNSGGANGAFMFNFEEPF